MKTILVTGQIGAGKSKFISLLKERGCSVFISDREAEKLWNRNSPCYSELKKLFFETDLYLLDGSLNRKKLADIIFTDLKRKKAVEKIIHHRTRQFFQEFVEKEKKKNQPWVFYEAPLISLELLKDFDQSILITTEWKKQKERLIKRGLSLLEIKQRLANQISDCEVKDQVDFIIDNRKNSQYLKQEVEKLLKKLKRS